MPDSGQICSFCGRPANEVKALLSNDNTDNPAFICTRCVGECGRALEATQAEVSKNCPVKSPKQLKEGLDEFVIAQEDSKREVAIAMYEHARRREVSQGVGHLVIEDENGQPEEVEVEKSNILQLGPSGTGKTHIARALARMLDLPFFVGDASSLTQAGYVGDDVESLLQGLVAEANGDTERAEWGIIFLDEVDKIARKSGRTTGGFRDVTGEGVQQALLKVVEGSKVLVPRGQGAKMVVSGGAGGDLIDTTNILFICAGSFAGIEEIVERRLNKSAGVGFGKAPKQMLEKEAYRQVTVDDIEEFGIIPELAGRLPVLTSTYTFTEDELIEILTKPKNAILKQFRATYAMDGISLQFDVNAVRAIAREAAKRPTGARALRQVTKAVLKPYSFDAPSDPTIQSILITEDAVTNPGSAKIVRKATATA